MKYIITESQLLKLISEEKDIWLLRRKKEIDDYVKLALRRVPSGGYSYHDYVEEIAWQVAEEYPTLGQDKIDKVLDYVRDNYWKEIETAYLKNGE